nr:hypothetical protein [Candidatus Sigynarchaeota archaeon]
MVLSERVKDLGTNLRFLASWFMVITSFTAIVAGSGGLIFWEPLPYYGSPSTWLILGGCIAIIIAVIVIIFFLHESHTTKKVQLILDIAFSGTYITVLLNPQVEIMVLVGMAGLGVEIVSNIVLFFSRIKDAPGTGTNEALHATTGIILGSFSSLLFKFGEQWGMNAVAWSMPAILLACSFITLASNHSEKAIDASHGQESRARIGPAESSDETASGRVPALYRPAGLIGFVLGFFAIAFVELLDVAFLVPFPHALATTMLPACLILGVISLVLVYIFAISPRAGPRIVGPTRREHWRGLGSSLVIFALFFAIPVSILVACVIIAPFLLVEPLLMGYVLSFIPYTIFFLVQLGNALQLSIRHEVAMLASKNAKSMHPSIVQPLFGSCIGAVMAIAFLVIDFNYHSDDMLAFLALVVLALLGIIAMNVPRSTGTPEQRGTLP